MKKILYSIITLVAAGSLFTACSDDNNGDQLSVNPAADLAGTYTGEWSVNVHKVISAVGSSQDKDSYNGKLAGTVILEATQDYISKMTVSCPKITEEDGTQRELLSAEGLDINLNVMQASDSYRLYNTTQPLKDAKGLKVDKAGVIGSKDGDVLKITFSQDAGTSSDFATLATVKNAAASVCTTAAANRDVTALCSSSTTINYTFEGKK